MTLVDRQGAQRLRRYDMHCIALLPVTLDHRILARLRWSCGPFIHADSRPNCPRRDPHLERELPTRTDGDYVRIFAWIIRCLLNDDCAARPFPTDCGRRK